VGERDLLGGEERWREEVPAAYGERVRLAFSAERDLWNSVRLLLDNMETLLEADFAPKFLTRIMWQQIESLGDARCSLVFPQLGHVGRSSFN